jgi:hypothetical protein
MNSILALIYEDILEFHQAALRVFQKSSMVLILALCTVTDIASMETAISISMEGFQNMFPAYSR